MSLHIDVDNTRILFDLGASNLFTKNAEHMGIDLDAVDTVVLSHGHYDHGGGLSEFFEMNHKADVFISKHAYGEFYTKRELDQMKYIGLDQETKYNKQIVFVDKLKAISDKLTIISGIKGNHFFPSGNQRLYRSDGKDFILDDFRHEQNLVVEHNGHNVLFAGCAHNGILNILDYVEKEMDIKITHIVSGFHMYNRREKTSENPYIVQEVGKALNDKRIQVWTGHCTGPEAFEQLSSIMGNRIHQLSTGKEIIISEEIK